MPYRLDIDRPPADAVDRLVELGALELEPTPDGLAAILPDAVTPESVAAHLGVDRVRVSGAEARDNGSVWILAPRPIRIGGLVIAPEGSAGAGNVLRLADSAAFGSGHHPTTALCIEALEEEVRAERVDSLLDVGTGSGILALAALAMGVQEAVGVDIDKVALKAAAENARLNGMADRLRLVHGGADAVDGTWPLVVANVLAAPLMEMAPDLVRRVGTRGRVILSGIPRSVEGEVRGAYEHVGMRHVRSKERAGWMVVMLRSGW